MNNAIHIQINQESEFEPHSPRVTFFHVFIFSCVPITLVLVVVEQLGLFKPSSCSC